MRKQSVAEVPPEGGPVELSISTDKVCFFIVKVREFEVKDAVTEPDPASNTIDDGMISVLEDHRDDPVRQELATFVGDLSQDEQIDLVALAWLGRDDNTRDDWVALREEAARAWRPARSHTANYLIGMPLVSEYLEEGLSMLGCSCSGA